ncbi:MAG: hypothetical protein J3K34DRAFT_438010 [Monoraphidium minutum]|nr:MAG: hypothetical protein J3K34DRAFT_438010 [Monoraphidium minutum]
MRSAIMCLILAGGAMAQWPLVPLMQPYGFPAPGAAAPRATSLVIMAAQAVGAEALAHQQQTYRVARYIIRPHQCLCQ